MKETIVSRCAGFTGSHLCEYLYDRSEKVLCITNLLTDTTTNQEGTWRHPNFEFVTHDITEPLTEAFIVSRIGGIPELVEEGYNGYLFEAGNMVGLRALLERLTQSTEELKRLEAGALESAKRYSISQHIETLEALYKNQLRDY
jgi:nucleoside-diphosphate-sugar epimerase